MKSFVLTKVRRWNIVLHRDIGYFFSGLIIIYCISGLALNHIDDWNPDFVLVKKSVEIPKTYTKDEINDQLITEFSALAEESDYTIYDFPTSSKLKIYYKNASLLIDLENRKGEYERLTRRTVIFQSNILHRNSIKGWKLAADVFSVMLIFIAVSGCFMLRGKTGLFGRGKWFILAGMIPPMVAVILFDLLQ